MPPWRNDKTALPAADKLPAPLRRRRLLALLWKIVAPAFVVVICRKSRRHRDFCTDAVTPASSYWLLAIRQRFLVNFGQSGENSVPLLTNTPVVILPV